VLVEGDEWRAAVIEPSSLQRRNSPPAPACSPDAPTAAGRRSRDRAARCCCWACWRSCAFAFDGAAYNWSAVDLRTEHGASPELAAWAFTAFAIALAVGRTMGDRHVARFGRTRVVQGCAGAAATDGQALNVSQTRSARPSF